MASLSTTVVQVTPETARVLLANNVNNRAIRRAHVANLAAVMARGEWKLTHQGIAVSEDGRLIDGQHRLEAVLLSGVSVPMMLTTGARSDTFAVLDQGARRTLSDRTGMPRQHAEIVNVFAELLYGNAPRAPMSAVTALLGCFGDLTTRLLEVCPSNARGVTAAVRAGVILRAAMTPSAEHDIFAQYRAMILCEATAMNASTAALFRQLTQTQTTGRTMRVDTLARAWVAFNPSATQLTRILIKDPDRVHADMRDAVNGLLGTAKAAA